MKLVAGIDLDLIFELIEYNDVKSFQINHDENVLSDILKEMFQEFTTRVPSSNKAVSH